MSICSIIFYKIIFLKNASFTDIIIRNYFKMQIIAKTITKSTPELGRQVVELLTECG